MSRFLVLFLRATTHPGWLFAKLRLFFGLNLFRLQSYFNFRQKPLIKSLPDGAILFI